MPPEPEDLFGQLIQVVVAVAVIGAVLNMGGATQAGSETLLYPDTGENRISGAAAKPGEVAVSVTTGAAVELDGSGAFESPEPSQLDGPSWTSCVTADLTDGVDRDGTYTAVAWNNATLVLFYDAGDWAVYHDNGTHDGLASVPAASPGELTPVCGRYDAGSNALSIRADGNWSTSRLTNATTARNASFDWEGRLEEARVFGDPVSNQTVMAYESDPVAPLPGTNRLARVMFDEGEGGDTRVYFAGSRAELPAGFSWVAGAGSPAGRPAAGEDYGIRADPFSLVVLEGGYLEGAPVVYVDWEGGGNVPIDIVGVAALLMALLLLAHIARDLM